MTEPEMRLWFALRHDLQWKFRRQQPIGPYICDFVCFLKRVVVEVDGAQHAGSVSDGVRDRLLESLGFVVVRVWNDDVMTDLGGVLDAITAVMESRPDRHRNRPVRSRDR